VATKKVNNKSFFISTSSPILLKDTNSYFFLLAAKPFSVILFIDQI